MQPSQVRLIKKNDDKNQNCLDGAACDLSKIKYYNYNKKGYYLNNFTELSKN